MADYTKNLNLSKQALGENPDRWHIPLNGNFDTLDAAIGRLARGFKSATILEPDKVYAVTPSVQILRIPGQVHPSGVVVDAVYLDVSENATMSVLIQVWDNPQDLSPITIATLSVAGTDMDVELPDVAVPAGKIIKCVLDTADVDQISLTIAYHDARYPYTT